MSTRTEQINLRCTEAEAARIRESAARLGLTAAEYLRQCVEEAQAQACPTCRGTGKIEPRCACCEEITEGDLCTECHEAGCVPAEDRCRFVLAQWTARRQR